MTHIYFVRHAESDNNVHNDSLRPLTPKGLSDRKLVTAYLKAHEVSVVFSSPYQRARDTVSAYAESQTIQILYDENFRERAVGSWVEDFNAYAQQQWSDFDYKLEGGESLAAVQARNIASLQQILADYPDKHIAVATHGTALSTILHFFNPTFGYTDFQKIADLMPWIVHFTFNKQEFAAAESINLFSES